MSDPASKVWPITVDEHPQLAVGDIFTMEVPCDPKTGIFSFVDGAVLAKRTFKIVKEITR